MTDAEELLELLREALYDSLANSDIRIGYDSMGGMGVIKMVLEPHTGPYVFEQATFKCFKDDFGLGDK
jgi:hypothetical protein